MSKKDISHLYKERITLSDYDALLQELSDAISGGQSALTELLFGTLTPDVYSEHGTYQLGLHNHCAGLTTDRVTEKRLCKCMYYKNSTYSKRCEDCAYTARFDLVGEYKIKDYEVPAFYYGDGIGEIDLIISDGSSLYATEVKPYKGNNETLLRMIAEIMTYTLGYPEGTYKKAIAFFEGTPQETEYERKEPATQELLAKADITVFRFVKTGEKTYQICKL